MNTIVFLLTSFNRAGAEQQVVQLARGFLAKGWSIHIISMTEPTAPYEELVRQGIGFEHLDMRRGIPDPRAIMKLRRILNRIKPHIVHSHLVHANLLARATRLFTRASMPVLITTAHNSNEGGMLRMLLYRLTDPLCELTTNVSHDAVERFIQIKAVPRRKIVFIPNGIDSSVFEAARDSAAEDRAAVRAELGMKDAFIWLAVGRLTEAKDYPNLLSAFKTAAQTREDCVLLIVGEGELEQEVMQWIQSHSLQDKVKQLGIRDDVIRLMRASDAYVMSSRWEGMPMVLLEASACGLPIVATDAGGNREIVQSGRSGLIVPPADSLRLAEAMTAMMALPAAGRAAMGECGRAYIRQMFDMNVIIERWESIYARFMEAG